MALEYHMKTLEFSLLALESVESILKASESKNMKAIESMEKNMESAWKKSMGLFETEQE